MSSHASYIFSAYSFINSLSKEQILNVGNLSNNGNPIPSFDEDLLINLCADAAKIFQKEENVIEIDGDVTIVGDIHGSFHDLLRILNIVEKDQSKVLFLGDYVDRGNFSLECITLLFTLKVLKPTKYYLLRGNHEFEIMASNYGFKKEILNYHNPKKTDQVAIIAENPKIEDEIDFDIDDEYDEQSEKEQLREKDTKEVPTKTISNEDLCDNYYANHININCYKYTNKLYNSFIKAFSYLPICSIINKTTICLHGGLSPLIEKVDSIRSIKRPISHFDNDPLVSDLLWSDPSPGNSNTYDKNTRGRGKLFNGVAVVTFLKRNNLKRLIRGHECVDEGIGKLFNEKCITVFSCSSYKSDMKNASGILKIFKKDDLIESIVLQPLHRLKKCDANYYKVEAFNKTNENKKIAEYKSGLFSSILNNRMAKLNPSKSEAKNVFFRRNMVLKSGPRKKTNICSSNMALLSRQPQICSPKVSNASCSLFAKNLGGNWHDVKENYLRDSALNENQIELKSVI